MKTPKAEQLGLPFLTETRPPLFREMEEVQVRLTKGNSVTAFWHNAHIVMPLFPGDDSKWIVQLYPGGRVAQVNKRHIRSIER